MKKLDFACNPYLPGKEHVPDGEPHIFGDRLYVFGSHDELGSDRYCTGSYVGWSAALNYPGNWRYEGVILEKGQDPYDPEGTKDYYAPDVAQGPDGRYYLYYSIEGSMVISVAVCEQPAGKYTFYGHVKDRDGHVIGSTQGDDYQFDPAVLIDDDGKIYLYSGQGLPISEVNGRQMKGAMVYELEKDMLTIKGKPKIVTSNTENVFEENRFFEASSIRKMDGKYYFIYSPLPNTHLLCYATSDYPDREFVYGGVLVSNADIFPEKENCQEPMNYWGNNHGSLLKMAEKYYIFYHRNSNRTSYARQGCVEQIYKDENGGFIQAELTSNGMNQDAFPMKGTYPAYIAWRLQKKKMDPFVPFQFLKYSEADPYIAETEDVEIPYIANMQEGAKAGYRYMAFDGTESRFFVKIRGTGNGEIVVSVNEQEFVRIPVKAAAEWTEFEAFCSMDIVNIKKGDICMTYHGSGSIDILYLGMR